MLLDERVLRFIVALGEELHFGRAAAKLCVSQPALSATVRSLERGLGVELFRRSSRHVELTEAGRILMEEARLLMNRAERAVALVRESGTDAPSPLRIGYSPLINLPWLGSLMSWAKYAPGVETKIEFISVECADAVRQLVAGQLHGALLLGHVDDAELASNPLFEEQLALAMSPRHPLAGALDITFENLKDEPLIWFRRDLNPFLYDSFLALCSARSYVPNIVQVVTSVHECLHFAAEGFGITLLPIIERNTISDSNAILYAVPEPALSIATEFAYRRDNNSEALTSLMQLLANHRREGVWP